MEGFLARFAGDPVLYLLLLGILFELHRGRGHVGVLYTRTDAHGQRLVRVETLLGLPAAEPAEGGA